MCGCAQSCLMQMQLKCPSKRNGQRRCSLSCPTFLKVEQFENITPHLLSGDLKNYHASYFLPHVSLQPQKTHTRISDGHT